MELLRDANQQQKRAITSSYGPVAIIAGPGTGKTKTLTTRIAYLIGQGVKPQSILALTFTNKAAQEMRDRVGVFAKESAPTIATFHALCLDILRHAEPDLPLVFATDVERAAALKKVLPAGMKARDLGLAISRHKGETISDDATISRIAQAYDHELSRRGLLDFDDLLRRVYALLQTDGALKQALNSRYQHILIDEFQDTNDVQWRIVQLLRGSDSVFVIGDPKQSIYSFRGAGQDMFERFRADFSSSRVITLDTNYRSQRAIVALANTIFPEASQLRAHASQAGVVRVTRTVNEYGEADLVLHTIEQGIGGSNLQNASVESLGRSFRDFAVLYRTHHAARTLQRRLQESGIPYQVVGEGSPYEHPDIQAIIGALRWMRDNTQALDIRGFTSVQAHAVLQGIDTGQPVSRVATEVLQALALDDADTDRQVRLKQFLGTLVRFDALPDGVQAYLRYIDQLAENEFYDPLADAVTLLTIHASKGLEFTHVMLLAVEDGTLPLARKSGDVNIEEEKRLFYVAATRAKQQLDILHVDKRAGQLTQISRFIRDIPERMLPRHEDPASEQIRKRIQKRQFKARQTTLF